MYGTRTSFWYASDTSVFDSDAIVMSCISWTVNCLFLELPPALQMCTAPTHFVVISWLLVSSRPFKSNPLSAFLLAPQIRLLLTIVRVYKLYSLAYLLIYLLCLGLAPTWLRLTDVRANTINDDKLSTDAVIFTSTSPSSIHVQKYGLELHSSNVVWLEYWADFTVLRFIFMAALCNRGPLYFYTLVSIFYLSFFSRLISATADWMSTILLHMAWP